MSALEFSGTQFTRLRDLVYQKLGLYFEDRKLYFVHTRVDKRMRAVGLQSADDYIFHLRFCDPEGAEMQQLANLLTTNETYMFREYEQLAAFADHCLPAVLARKAGAGVRTLRIWSAGCSSGEEPYTLAMILLEVLEEPASWEIEILATDIDQNVLERARAARYDERSVRFVPELYADRHLIRSGTGYMVRPDTRRLVTIRHMNLHDRSAMRAMRAWDFVFCRNVLIYFDDLSRRSAVDHFYAALNPGGYIFLGHSESVGRITSAFRLEKAGNFLVYAKPMPAAPPLPTPARSHEADPRHR